MTNHVRVSTEIPVLVSTMIGCGGRPGRQISESLQAVGFWLCSCSIATEPTQEHRPRRNGDTGMDAIETLMNEHRMIERVLDGLVAFADEIHRKGSTEKEELGRFVTFVREFADACHHGKEEDILFAAMVEHGFPRNGGPIAVMLHEHDQGRGLVRILRDRAEQPAAWSDADRQEIAEVAGGFADMLRGHIHKEDAILYPMAEQHLPPEAMDRGRRGLRSLRAGRVPRRQARAPPRPRRRAHPAPRRRRPPRLPRAARHRLLRLAPPSPPLRARRPGSSPPHRPADPLARRGTSSPASPPAPPPALTGERHLQ